MAAVGVFEIVLGLAVPLPPMVALGVVLLAAGAWNLCRTSVTGLIVDGLAAIVAGAFLCLASQWTGDASTLKAQKWIFGGVLHIVWGVRRLALYRTARGVVNDPPAIARLDATVRELSKGSAKDDPTIVEFRTGRFRRHRNRLGLYAEGAIGLLEQQVVRLEKRTDMWIEARGSDRKSTRLNSSHLGISYAVFCLKEKTTK